MHVHNDENLRASKIHSALTPVVSAVCLNPSLVGHAGIPLTEFLEGSADDRCLLRQSDYSIRLAESPRQRCKASLLIKRMYSWRGYNTEDSTVIPYNQNQLTFEASNESELFGTLTLGIDSEEGLSADQLYKEELNAFRRKGKKICEVSKLAFEPQFSSKELFASLFHLAYIYAYTIHKVQHAFIEVNPRHAAFYKRMLGFRQIGEQRICPRVDAPAVLLHLDLDYMDAQISSFAGMREHKEKSLYPYFFSRHKEKGVALKLRGYMN